MSIEINRNAVTIAGDGQAAPEIEGTCKAQLNELRTAVAELPALKKYQSALSRLREAENEVQALETTRSRLLSDIEQAGVNGENDDDFQRQLIKATQGAEGLRAKLTGIQKSIPGLRQSAFTESQNFVVRQAPRLHASAKKNLEAATTELEQRAQQLIPQIAAVEALRDHFKHVGDLGTRSGAESFLKTTISLPR